MENINLFMGNGMGSGHMGPPCHLVFMEEIYLLMGSGTVLVMDPTYPPILMEGHHLIMGSDRHPTPRCPTWERSTYGLGRESRLYRNVAGSIYRRLFQSGKSLIFCFLFTHVSIQVYRERFLIYDI